MLTTLAAPAFAKTWDIADGDITVKAGEAEGPNKVKQGDSDFVKDEGDTIITGTSDKNTVTIEAENEGDKVEVTLKDVNIDASRGSEAAVSVTGKGDTNIELDGDNELQGGNGHAGLEHNKTDTSGELTIQDNDKNGSLKAAGGKYGAGIGGAGAANDAQVKITGGKITATGGEYGAGIGGGFKGSGDVTITGGEIISATGGKYGAGIGGGEYSSGKVTIEGNTEVNVAGGTGGAGIGGGYGAKNNSNSTGNQITIRSNENGSPTVNAVGGGTKKGIADIGGAGIGTGCNSNADTTITLEGKVTITATAGKDNVAIGDKNGEQEFNGLAPGSNVTRSDSEGNDISLPGDKVPTPSGGDSAGGGSTGGDSAGGGSTGGGSTGGDSSGGGSADASVQESVFPGLVVTDKDGQRISYTSTQSGNTLTVCVGRFTASLRASLSTLRQLRAEGIETITFQTILCSTTLSVDELLAMGGEDTEVVLTHHIRSSTLTVGGKAV